MRNALIGILLTGTILAPATAQVAGPASSPRIQQKMEHYQRLEQRNQQRYERSVQRQPQSQQQQAAPRAQADAAPAREERAVRVERRQSRREDSGNPAIEARDERRESRIERRAAIANGEAQVQQATPAQAQDQTQVRRWRTRGDDATRNRTDRTDRADRTDRNGDRTAQYRDGRNWNRDGNRDWNRDWRRDSRYDWQRYRYSNRNLYRPGRYYSPYRNYGYNRFTIGLTLGSGYYSNRYWINDPYQYRLPPAYPGTRWIRYYDDVLLVDLYTGQVIDVIYSFFW